MPTLHDHAVSVSGDQDYRLWLHCTCGWRLDVGYEPTLSNLRALYLSHLIDVGVRKPRKERGPFV
jgi:hypothetical protein